MHDNGDCHTERARSCSSRDDHDEECDGGRRVPPKQVAEATLRLQQMHMTVAYGTNRSSNAQYLHIWHGISPLVAEEGHHDVRPEYDEPDSERNADSGEQSHRTLEGHSLPIRTVRKLRERREEHTANIARNDRGRLSRESKRKEIQPDDALRRE